MLRLGRIGMILLSVFFITALSSYYILSLEHCHEHEASETHQNDTSGHEDCLICSFDLAPAQTISAWELPGELFIYLSQPALLDLADPKSLSIPVHRLRGPPEC